MRVFTLLLVSVCLVPITGLANSVTVGCGVPGSYDYNWITGALQALHAISNRDHTITISGACFERVDVTDFENVSLIGTPGATITATTEPHWKAAVLVAYSKNITLSHLEINGVINPASTGWPTPPVINVTDSSVSILGCSIQGGVGVATNQGSVDGVAISNNSHVSIANSVIQNNSGAGVSAGDNSSVQIRGSQTQKAVIQHNGSGVAASGGSSVSIVGETDVLDNLYYGVQVVNGNVGFNGNTRIANNAGGLTARGGVVNKGGNGVLLIEHNTDFGVSSWLGSSMLLMNATIDNNGSTTSTFPTVAGVAVDANSTAYLMNVTISNSPVTGLLVIENASATLVGSTITGNGDDGVRIETLSGVRFQGDQSTVTGNSGSDLVCDSDTYVVVAGDSPNIGKAKCPSFKKKK